MENKAAQKHKIKPKRGNMLTAKPFVPFLNVEDVPATGLTCTIKSVGETPRETKDTVANANEFIVWLTLAKSEKFPDGQASRMFGPTSPMAKELSILSGQKADADGNLPIDESKLPGKKIVIVRVKSAGKFSNQDTLTIKRA